MLRRVFLARACSALLALCATTSAYAACPLPHAMTNGQMPDATQMMANFNALVACLAPGGSTNALQYNGGAGSLAGLGPLTDGQLAIGSTGGPPQAQTLSAGSGIAITNGAGSVTIATTAGSAGTGLYRQVMSATPTSASTGLSTWLNQGTSTVADSAVGLNITAPQSAANSVRGRYAAVPSTPYTITVLLGATRNSSGTSMAGIGWYDGTAKLQVISYETNGIFGTILRVRRFTNPTTASTIDFTAFNNFFSEPIWLQINDDGTNVSFSFSQDGVNFLAVYSVAKASGFLGASGYSNLIFFVNPGPGVNGLGTLMSWTQT